MSVTPIILHIDFDSFFPSVEQQYNPSLRGRPVGVTAHNGRTCIIAASREAKKLGIGTASNTYDALKICPSLRLVRADFEKYMEVSKKFIRLCKYYSPIVEVFSIDELFMDVSLTQSLFGSVDGLIVQLKKKVLQELGAFITVSVGVSHNKLLAKLGSGLHKPNGVTYVTKENLNEVYKEAQLTDICGIGSRFEKRLHIMGIYTLLELQKTPLRMLIAEFGYVAGTFLFNVGKGVDLDPVHSFAHSPDAKSVSRQYCLPRNEYDQRVVFQNVYELCEELAMKLRKLHKKTRHVGVSLRGTEEIGGHQLLHEYTSCASIIFAQCMKIIHRQIRQYDALMQGRFEVSFEKREDVHIPGYVRRIGVWVGNLVDSSTLPTPLFPEFRKRAKLDDVVDKLNDKFGSYTIRNGFLLYAKKLKTVPNGFLGDRHIRVQLANDYDLLE